MELEHQQALCCKLGSGAEETEEDLAARIDLDQIACIHFLGFSTFLLRCMLLL